MAGATHAFALVAICVIRQTEPDGTYLRRCFCTATVGFYSPPVPS